MFKQFALCLGPAILAYGITLIMTQVEDGTSGLSEFVFGVIIFLIIGGAIISGLCVGRKVYRAAKGSDGIRRLLAFLTFLGVGVAYLALGFTGCCGVAGWGEYLSYQSFILNPSCLSLKIC